MAMHAREPRLLSRHSVTVGLLLALALAAGTTRVVAHAFPESSDPAPGENLQGPPHEVTITFDEELDPDGSRFRVLDAAGSVVGKGNVDLTVADRNVLRGDVEIKDRGLYSVRWTALSIDGDTTHGSFSFGFLVSGAVPSNAPQEEAPDTAMPADTAPTPWLPLAGVLLLGLGTIAGIATRPTG